MGPFFPHSVLLYFRLGISLQACLLQIVGYRNLIADVEKLRREPYDSDNPQHEEMLLKVSPSLMSVNDYQTLRPGSLFALRIQSWGYEDMGAVTDCQGWVLLLVACYFFIRKFIWEINFKASWLIIWESIRVYFYGGVAPRTWLKFALFQMRWKLQEKWETICQSVMGFLLTTLIHIKGNEVDFCFSNSPLGKLPKILLMIIYSCNLANVQKGGKGFYLAHRDFQEGNVELQALLV